MGEDTSVSGAGWFYLSADGQNVGPYDDKAFTDLVAKGYLSEVTLVWKTGQAEWQPVKDVRELWKHAPTSVGGPSGALSDNGAPSSAAAGSGPAGSSEQASSQRTAGRTAVKAAKAVKASVAPVDRELAAFQAEMSALGATDAAPVPDAADDLGEAERAETPPLEDQRFQDDDGTWFRWDRNVRRFVEEEQAGAAAGVPTALAPEYQLEEMTFQMEDEKIPEYKPPKSDDEDELPDDDGTEEAGTTNGSSADAEGQTGASGPKTGAETVMEKLREKQKRARESAEQEAKWFEVKVNTSVYITGLPDDATETEVAQFFAKCGIIKEDDDGKPRIKMYRDKAKGMIKGDGLVTYLKEPSVDLACRILDGAPFRDDISKTLTVQPAKFEMRGDQYVPKKKPKKNKKKVVNKVEKMLGWGGFDDVKNPTLVTVILKHMFTPSELEEEPALKDDLEVDVTTECAKVGAVDKVRVFQYHPEGAVSVKFKDEDAAQGCIKLMDGRFFGGRQVSAGLWDGTTNYNVKKPKESIEEQAARLERFAAEIEDG